MSTKIRRLLISRKLTKNINLPLNGCWFKLEGLPEDTHIVGIGADYERNAVLLYLQSESFEPVPEDEVIPIVELEVSVKYEEVEA